MAILARERRFVVAGRAGFWRRVLALFLDVLVVLAPFQIAVIILFPLTGGAVQMDFGLPPAACQPTLETPAGSPAGGAGTFVLRCSSSVAGLMTANVLRTFPIAVATDGTPVSAQSYRLNAEGKPVAGFAIDSFVQFSMVMYLIASLALAGRSLGMRALRIAVIDAARGGRPPLRKVLLRYGYVTLGALPGLLWAGYVHFVGVGHTDESTIVRNFALSALAVLCGAAWGIANLVFIVRKRDPFYDRWAGTAVVRERDRLTAPG